MTQNTHKCDRTAGDRPGEGWYRRVEPGGFVAVVGFRDTEER